MFAPLVLRTCLPEIRSRLLTPRLQCSRYSRIQSSRAPRLGVQGQELLSSRPTELQSSKAPELYTGFQGFRISGLQNPGSFQCSKLRRGLPKIFRAPVFQSSRAPVQHSRALGLCTAYLLPSVLTGKFIRINQFEL